MIPQLALTGLGMSAWLAGAAHAFAVLRWLGVAYLVWLALRAFTAPERELTAGFERRTLGALFWRGFFVSSTNPKTLFFCAAFFPQFMDPQRPLAPQFALLAATFVGLAALVDSGWAFLAGRVGGALKVSGKVRNRLTGGFLLGAGLGLALARRP